jgi:hypothetical protein
MDTFLERCEDDSLHRHGSGLFSSAAKETSSASLSKVVSFWKVLRTWRGMEDTPYRVLSVNPLLHTPSGAVQVGC